MTWDIVAWNAAALAVLGDYRAVPSRERNVLRRLFHDPVMRTKLHDWEADARFVVSAFRMDIVRQVSRRRPPLWRMSSRRPAATSAVCGPRTSCGATGLDGSG